VKHRVRLIALAAVAALMLAIVPTAFASVSAGEILTVSQTADCLGYVVETQAGVVTECMPVAGANVPFAPSADGSVAFTAVNNDPSAGGQGSLWLVRPTHMTLQLDASVWDTDPSISYDGSRVTFARFDPVTWSSDIYVVNSDGSGLKLVASGQGTNDLTHPELSPDGRSIAYWCGPARYAASMGPGCGPLLDGTYRGSGVMLMNVDGGDKRMILIGAGGALEPGGPNSLSWAPNGQWLTMDGLAGGGCSTGGSPCNQQVFAYRTDGSDLFNNLDPSRQVTHETNQYGASDPQFCGNSTQILYQAQQLYALVDQDGSNQREIRLSPQGLPWGECIPPATGDSPPPTVNATQVSVPRLERLSYGAAERRLASAHLRVGKVQRRFSPRVKRDHVIAQFPKAGAQAHRSTKSGPPVRLVVSRGKAPAKKRR
jgi:PASTA domain